MDDHDAIARMKRGDIRGLSVLVERYQLRAVRTARMITRDQSRAEDVVQATFLRIYHHIDQFDMARPFAPWFMRSVVNAALQAMRGSDRQISLEAPVGRGTDGPAYADILADDDPLPEMVAESTETRAVIRDALDQLPAEQRAVIVMRYYLDMSEREMADALEVPPGTVKWRLHAARKQLGVLLRHLQNRDTAEQQERLS